MKTKFIFTFFVALLFNMVEVKAQGQQGNRQLFSTDFWERRNTYIKAEVGLTTDEAGKFIPLENEFKQKIFEVGRECRSVTRESQNKQKMTDAEYLQLIDCYIDTRMREAQIEKEYFEKFKKVITPEKIHKYQEADAKFSRELIITRRIVSPDRNNTNRPANRNNTNQSGNRR